MQRYITALIAGLSLLLAGCCSTRNVARWEYKTVIIPNNAVPMAPPDKGWTSDDAVINALLKDGWKVAGYGIDQANSQWFLMKRHKK